MSKQPRLTLAYRIDDDIDVRLWRAVKTAVYHQVLDFKNRTQEQINRISLKKLVRKMALVHRLTYIRIARERQDQAERLYKRMLQVRNCQPFGGYFRFKIHIPGDDIPYEPPMAWHCRASFCPHCHARRMEEVFARLTAVTASTYETLTLYADLGNRWQEFKPLVMRYNENLGQKLKGQRSIILRSFIPAPGCQGPPDYRLRSQILLLDPRASRVQWDRFQKDWSPTSGSIERDQGVWDRPDERDLVAELIHMRLCPGARRISGKPRYYGYFPMVGEGMAAGTAPT